MVIILQSLMKNILEIAVSEESRILDGPFFNIYLNEIELLANITIKHCDLIFSRFTKPNEGEDYISVDPEINYLIGCVPNDVAKMANLIRNGRPKHGKETPEQYKIRLKRNEIMEYLFQGCTFKAIFSLSARVALEHIDEYIDKLCEETTRRKKEDNLVFPLNIAVWEKGAIGRILSDSGKRIISEPIRMYVAKEKCLYHLGTKLNFSDVYNECVQLQSAFRAAKKDKKVYPFSGGAIVFVNTALQAKPPSCS